MNPRYREPWGEACDWPRDDTAENERSGPQPRGPDWHERNPEASDMEAQRHRARITRGLTSGGRRL